LPKADFFNSIGQIEAFTPPRVNNARFLGSTALKQSDRNRPSSCRRCEMCCYG